MKQFNAKHPKSDDIKIIPVKDDRVFLTVDGRHVGYLHHEDIKSLIVWYAETAEPRNTPTKKK